MAFYWQKLLSIKCEQPYHCWISASTWYHFDCIYLHIYSNTSTSNGRKRRSSESYDNTGGGIIFYHVVAKSNDHFLFGGNPGWTNQRQCALQNKSFQSSKSYQKVAQIDVGDIIVATSLGFWCPPFSRKSHQYTIVTNITVVAWVLVVLIIFKIFANSTLVINPLIYAFARDDLRTTARNLFNRKSTGLSNIAKCTTLVVDIVTLPETTGTLCRLLLMLWSETVGRGPFCSNFLKSIWSLADRFSSQITASRF